MPLQIHVSSLQISTHKHAHFFLSQKAFTSEPWKWTQDMQVLNLMSDLKEDMMIMAQIPEW